MNSENNVEQIYDWLEHCSFHNLSTAQQEFVLSAMDKDLYDEMHLFIMASAKPGPDKEANNRVLQNVISHFDSRKRGISLLSFRGQKVSLAKAAIWIACLAGAFMWSLFREQTGSTKNQFHTLRDTVYIDVPVQVVSTVYDTVMVSRIKYIHKTSRQLAAPVIKPDQSPAKLESELHIVQATEQHSDLNSTRNNSLKYDSLACKIGFVSL